jgi:hypothetical protein
VCGNNNPPILILLLLLLLLLPPSDHVCLVFAGVLDLFCFFNVCQQFVVAQRIQSFEIREIGGCCLLLATKQSLTHKVETNMDTTTTTQKNTKKLKLGGVSRFTTTGYRSEAKVS